MKKAILFLTAILLTHLLHAQNEEEKKWGIKFAGFVKTDLFWDTRQVVAAREGHFLLWPAPPKYDLNGLDVNDKSSFNFMNIQTRLRGNITGPDVLGAKTSGVVEGAFFGHNEMDVNGFRMRHAFVKLNWTNTELLVGQTWHPMFIAQSFPLVVSFNTGAPFQPFSRNPQVRITQKFGKFSLAGIAFSHRDFTSAAGVEGLRNSVIPELHFQVAYSSENEEKGTQLLLGGGAGYKTLVPRLETDNNYKADESVTSFMAEAHAKIGLKNLNIRTQVHYGQNSYDLLMISSFAVTSVDPVTDVRTYTPLTSVSTWIDLHTTNPVWQFGLFGGYTQNLGAGRTIDPTMVLGSRGDIDHVWRISPRILYNIKKFRVAFEIEYTSAAFGTIGTDGKIQNSSSVANWRNLLGVYYFF